MWNSFLKRKTSLPVYCMDNNVFLNCSVKHIAHGQNDIETGIVGNISRFFGFILSHTNPTAFSGISVYTSTTNTLTVRIRKIFRMQKVTYRGMFRLTLVFILEKYQSRKALLSSRSERVHRFITWLKQYAAMAAINIFEY